jgi:hypothetical protein
MAASDIEVAQLVQAIPGWLCRYIRWAARFGSGGGRWWLPGRLQVLPVQVAAWMVLAVHSVSRP